MTTGRDRVADDEAALEAAFAALRDRAPEPSDALVARVLADAAAVAAVAGARRADTPARTPAAGPLARLAGWLRTAVPAPGAAAGLMAAGIAGLVVGLSAPAPVASVGARLGLAAEAVALIPEGEAFALLEAEDAP